ncbi:MAG: 2-amino-4-hydroxy-6-hydroxymethyldihydropteridine diphosphokinase [Deltaproteobacteria bacterium]|nr:2-amino-4-hydroxy-6-hydroxymethyldihydropteridine diphosphokinase [Deltaproteobacteria bacterium]MDE0032487.1 2-amino-4-hydroxy-6-hydroxymethyldihydropteridine diphosphokinase [Deltaproteobacteria bacterium]
MGSNQGDKEANCRRAVREIGGMPQTRLRQVSSWFATEPWGAASSEWYVNGAVAVDTGLEPQTLLRHCQALEARMGRRPSPVRWADRVIDLDILFFDDMVLEEPGLTIPHPELHRRRFVLVPLCEIAPDLRHPRLDGDVRGLLARVDDDKRIREGTSPGGA